MKRLIFSFLAISTFLPTGCTKEDFADVSLSVIATVEPIPLREALSDLGQQLSVMRPSTRGTTYDADAIAVLRRSDFDTATRTATEDAGDSLAYVVNFSEGGYAILGADPHLPSVIAIVERGEMSPEKLVAAKRSADSGEAIGTPTYINALVANYILSESNNPTIAPRIVADWVVSEHQPSFVKTKWSQGSTKSDSDGLYNKYCLNNSGQLCKAGCVAIALSQMLLHNHKTFGRGPRSISGLPLDWTKLDAAAGYADLSDAPAEIRDYAARFIHDIGGAVGMKYGIYESIAGTSDVLTFMKSSLMNRNYVNAQLVKVPCSYPENYGQYSNDPILKMAMTEYTETYIRPMVYTRKQPLYIIGSDSFGENPSGHAWILDGWMRKTRSVSVGGGPLIADYVYCNYGWGGDGDGLYAFGTFKNNYNCFNEIINYLLN